MRPPLSSHTCRRALSKVSAVQYMRSLFPAFAIGVFHQGACNSSIQRVNLLVKSGQQQTFKRAILLFLLDGAEALYDGFMCCFLSQVHPTPLRLLLCGLAVHSVNPVKPFLCQRCLSSVSELPVRLNISI